MTEKKDIPSALNDSELDAASGGTTGAFIGGINSRYEPVTLERGLRSDGELVQAATTEKGLKSRT